MSKESFRASVSELIERASALERGRPVGQPEAETKDKLLTPFLDALGYSPEERTLEGEIRSLIATREWVDYFLLPARGRRPWLMVEAKSLWEGDLWTGHQSQVLDYLRDYSLMVGAESPVLWVLLTNFKEWHVVRLNERQPFWSFNRAQLEVPAFADQVYERLAREEFHRERLNEYYSEQQRQSLADRTQQFLRDLKVWRLVLANGLQAGQPGIGLRELADGSHTLLLRLLFVRLLEVFGQEPFYSLGILLEGWRRSFRTMPFAHMLRHKFKDTWADYNTELFAEGAVDTLEIPNEYLEMLITPNAVPDIRLLPMLQGHHQEYRSIYNYDFTTLSHDVLGTAYEQFLAHRMVLEGGFVRIVDDATTRKKEGVYYTPDFVVDAIVERTLGPRVRVILAEAEAHLAEARFAEAERTISKLLRIRVLDPACGSGSFLLAAHRFLLEAIERYNRQAASITVEKRRAGGLLEQDLPVTISDPAERVLVHSIFGVDLDPKAVQLAKLSLWTSLLQKDPGRYGRRGQPHAQLPALTVNIREGDSLVQSPTSSEVAREVIARASDLCAKAKDLESPAEDRKQAADELLALIDELAGQTSAGLEACFGSQTRRPFNWRLEFPDVFDPRGVEREQGFDVVLGNPPYYNVDSTFGASAPEIAWLRNSFPEVFSDKSDILFYFLARGTQVLREGGDLGFIVSRSFLQADKARNLRRLLKERTTLRGILDFLGHKVFKAGIATCIIHYSIGSPSDGHSFPVQFMLDSRLVKQQLPRVDEVLDGVVRVEVKQRELGDDRWILSPYRKIFDELDGGAPLREVVTRCGKGMETGANGVFVVDEIAMRSCQLVPDASYLRPRASNENLWPYGVVDNGERVLWTGDTPFDQLPTEVQRYLQRNRKALESRAAFQRGDCEWYRFTWPLHADVHFGPKIMAPYRGNRNSFVVDEHGEWLGLTNTTHVFCADEVPNLYALCALLNSLPVSFRYRALGGLGKLTGRGMYEYFENQIGDIRIPELSETDEETLATLARSAHDLFAAKRHLVEALQSHLSGEMSGLESFKYYCDTGGPYGDIVQATSENSSLVGHLLALRLVVRAGAFSLVGQVTEDPDWDEAEVEWRNLVDFRVEDAGLRTLLLFRALHAIEFDPSFRRRQKLTGNEPENLVEAALRALKAPVYDRGVARNVRIVEVLVGRAAAEAGHAPLEEVLIQIERTQNAIDEVALRVYGVERWRDLMQEALRIEF